MRSEIKRFGRGFVYAWNGIRAAVQEERNFRFHLCAACYAFTASVLAGLSAVEWALGVLCLGAVLAMELMNSAVERAVDKPDTTHWWSAGAAKDMAAGAVLFTALAAAVVGGCLLLPKIHQILATLLAAPEATLVLALTLIPAYLFTFRYPNQQKKGEVPDGKCDT